MLATPGKGTCENSKQQYNFIYGYVFWGKKWHERIESSCTSVDNARTLSIQKKIIIIECERTGSNVVDDITLADVKTIHISPFEKHIGGKQCNKCEWENENSNKWTIWMSFFYSSHFLIPIDFSYSAQFSFSSSFSFKNCLRNFIKRVVCEFGIHRLIVFLPWAYLCVMPVYTSKRDVIDFRFYGGNQARKFPFEHIQIQGAC